MSLLNIRLPVISTDYIPVQVTPRQQSYNPTSDSVYFAYTTVGAEPPANAPSAGWTAGTWTVVGTTYIALGLVGPNGGVSLTAGTYWIWVQVTDNPEAPVRQVGTLNLY